MRIKNRKPNWIVQSPSMMSNCEVDCCMGGWTSPVVEYIIVPNYSTPSLEEDYTSPPTAMWHLIERIFASFTDNGFVHVTCLDQWNTAEVMHAPSEVKNFWMLLNPLALSPMSWGWGGCSYWRHHQSQNEDNAGSRITAKEELQMTQLCE